MEERIESAVLTAVRERLVLWPEGIRPSPEFEGQATWSMADFVAWAGKLEKTREYAFLLYLYWASYTLGKIA